MIKKDTIKNTVGVLTLFFFVLEYTWVGGVHAEWSITNTEDFLNTISPPPAECEILYMDEKPLSPDAPWNMFLQMDAWMIAMHFDLKTINGHSGQYPLNWGMTHAMGSPEYDLAARDWIERHHLQNVYLYNLADDTWTPVS